MLIRLQLARKLDMNWWYFFQCPAFNAVVGKAGIRLPLSITPALYWERDEGCSYWVRVLGQESRPQLS
jgi:hypothetical protein